MTGFTPLSWAAHESPNPEVIKAYINAGLDVEERGENGWTPLMAAAVGNSNPEITKALIDGGAKVDARDAKVYTALMYAALSREHSSPEVVKTLVAAGADVNAKDNNGGTALIHAAISNRPEIITALLESGAEIEGVKMQLNFIEKFRNNPDKFLGKLKEMLGSGPGKAKEIMQELME